MWWFFLFWLFFLKLKVGLLTATLHVAAPRGCFLHRDAASASCRRPLRGAPKWRRAISAIGFSFTKYGFASHLVQTGQRRTINPSHSLNQKLLSIAPDTLSALKKRLHLPVWHHKNHSPGSRHDCTCTWHAVAFHNLTHQVECLSHPWDTTSTRVHS